MRFEALTQHRLSQGEGDPALLRTELEQMRYLVQIKLPKLLAKGEFNQFKVTGSNVNGSLGIGSEEESVNRVH